MSDFLVEQHPLPLFLPEGARVLMLGSFPPPRLRWSMDFYYPNMQNDMWRIFGLIFFDDKNYFINIDENRFDKERLVHFLTKKGIALGDTARSVIRLKNNASDAHLQVQEPIDLPPVLMRLPQCQTIVVTGQKAAETLCAMTNASQPAPGQYSECIYVGRALRIYRMPSSSRAYPKPLAEKAEVYRRMFLNLNMIE